MTSSEGLTSVEPWLFRQSNFNVDSWLLPDSFSRDNDLLARALHKSISTPTTTTTATAAPPHQTSPYSDPLSPSAFFDSATVSHHSPPQTLSNVSLGSDPEIAGGMKRKRYGVSGVSVPGGKPVKRRSRVSSKKSQTTFITADPANFRQMVQQVTGAKFIGSSHGIYSPIVKPEPHRLASRLPCGSFDRSSALPTLDTSAFLSNHHQENLVVGNNTFSNVNGTGLGISTTATINSFHQSSAMATTVTAKAEVGGGGGGSAVELDSFPSFPTLESWKVM